MSDAFTPENLTLSLLEMLLVIVDSILSQNSCVLSSVCQLPIYYLCNLLRIFIKAKLFKVYKIAGFWVSLHLVASQMQ